MLLEGKNLIKIVNGEITPSDITSTGSGANVRGNRQQGEEYVDWGRGE
jgi:hypothetical protein